MLSVRLDAPLQHQLEMLAKQRSATKSQIIKDALVFYMEYATQDKPTAYEVGKKLFGNYASGKGNLSQNYKKALKEKLHAKHSR